MQEDVGVALDEAWRQRFAGEVDDLGTGGHGEVRADRGDMVAVDEHFPAGVRVRVDPVEHLRGFEKDRLG